MIDSPFDVKEAEPLDGVLAAAFLFFVPFGGHLLGWLGTILGDYRLEGEAFGSIAFYALSVGFSISALRQPIRSVRIWGEATLLLDLGVLLLLLATPAIR